MIPPSPAINDAIGLLAALSDPEKSKAALEEMKKHSDTSQAALQAVQEKQRGIDQTTRDIAAMTDKLGKERVAFAEEKARAADQWQTQTRGLEEARRAVAASELKVRLLQDKLDADTSALGDRERAVVHDRAALDAREKDIAAREVKLADTLKDLGPIAKKLGL
jgi:uncharacterized coiled-coil protein SlyX